MSQQEKEKKKCVVAGRKGMKPSWKRYIGEGRAMKRQFARIEQHIKAHPNDATAPAALTRLEAARFGGLGEARKEAGK